MSRRGTVPVRGYALTRWSRAFVDVVEGRTDVDTSPATKQPTTITESADSHRITKARRYFRDRHVHHLTISKGRVTASVKGSQLEPFEVTLNMRTVDPDTVAGLLRAHGGVDEMMSLARGEQPRILGELVGPTESADVASDCSCPDDSVRCIHVLAVSYEVAAEIDRSATTLLTVMGTDLPELLDALSTPTESPDTATESPIDADSDPPVATDFFGSGAPEPAVPSPPRMNPLTDLDATALRSALRASGVAPGDIAEAVDELGDLYDRIIG